MSERFPAPYGRLYDAEIGLLAQAREALARLEGTTPEDLAKIEDMIAHLDQLFMLVVVGEFNSGKSSLINALLGDDYLETGILPTTARINILQQGSMKTKRFEGELAVLTHPAPILENLSLVDTPGTNAVFREHERLAREFVHRSDFVLFVMSATHAFAETDRLYLELIREYGTKVVILLNQIDLLNGDAEIKQVTDFVAAQSQQMLRFQPVIIPVSARWALESQRGANLVRRRKLHEESGIGKVTAFLRDTLYAEARLREKLHTPLRVAQSLLQQRGGAVARQLAVVESDLSSLGQIDSSDQLHRAAMGARLDAHFEPIARLFASMNERGARFIDENLQIRNLGQIVNWSAFQARFEQAVVADAPQQIGQRVDRLIGELLAEDRQRWQQTLGALRGMLERHQDETLGTVTGDLTGSMEAFEENVRQAEQALNRYSKREATDSLRNTQLSALADTAVIGLSGLVGGGGLVIFGLSELAEALVGMKAGAAASALLGPVGWAIGGAVALGGAWVMVNRRLPRAREKAKENLRQQVAALQGTFREALLDATSRELTAYRAHAAEALLPLRRYLDQLGGGLRRQQGELAALQGEMERLSAEIEQAAS
ncbi:MAG: hypothetical protein GXY76_08050 [Chloroflexi bacterium]|nr:hypothetical protein [Chloroflexota bacterium]